LQVVRVGSGDPVLLVHGVPTSGRLWRDVIPLLAPMHRVIVPDLPGYGRSAAGAVDVDTVVDGLHALGVDRPHVVGQDWGGVLAAVYASRFPVRSLTLTSTWLGWGWLGAQVTALPGLELLFYRAFGGAFWLSRGVTPARREAFLAEIPLRPGLAEQMRATARALPLRRLATLTVDAPVLCLWGDQDRFVPPAAGRRLAARFGGRFETVPGRHFAPFDAPAAYANALIRSWAASPPGA
jgi:pimeloyl-ACP methyl ester carboxylesterase